MDKLNYWDLDPKAKIALYRLLQGERLVVGTKAVLIAGSRDLGDGDCGIKEPTLRLTLSAGRSYLMTGNEVMRGNLLGQMLELVGQIIDFAHGDPDSRFDGVTVAGIQLDWQRWITFCTGQRE